MFTASNMVRRLRQPRGSLCDRGLLRPSFLLLTAMRASVSWMPRGAIGYLPIGLRPSEASMRSLRRPRPHVALSRL